ncbi:MAG: alpha-L-glutamate ligase-like protein [Pseudomonadota bacterium]
MIAIPNPLKLRRNGVIGINERNIDYINALNPRRLLKSVNDKMETKKLAAEADIPTPELYGVVENARDMRSLRQFIDRPDGFVIKPAQGSQGKGILVVDSPLMGGWRLANGRRVSYEALQFHVNNILSGMYSLGGQADKALIEYRVEFDDVFANISFKGVPDIRVIVLKGIPVFAMLRLPTAESDGKANLHKGGVGVGVDIATGLTKLAMQFDRMIDIHPDTAYPLDGISTPYWDEILMMAARSYDVTGLGYIGVDIVLDRDKGPLLLELNARPGISIQIANRCGMRGVLDKAMSLASDKHNAAKRVALARGLAGKRQPKLPERPVVNDNSPTKKVQAAGA